MPYKDPEKQKEYQRQWIAARRQAWLNKNGPCVECGSIEDLEVDHVDPAQKITHTVWSWSEGRRKDELEKCQVLCSGCHKKKTMAWRNALVEHGSITMYAKGCRCAECSERKRKHNARRKYDPDRKTMVWSG